MTFVNFAVMAKTPAANMAGPIRFSESPMGLLVGDYVGFSVVILDPETLGLIDAVPITGKPLSVEWLNDRVYVGDERTGLIGVYEAIGSDKKNTRNNNNDKKITEWVQVTPDLTGFPIPQPSDIAADENFGWLFVASKVDKVVRVFDEAGTLVRTIGGSGSSTPLELPQGIALDRAGQRIFVSDERIDLCSGWFSCALGAVVVYDYNGDVLGKIISDNQINEFKFGRAQGVAVDSAGRVYLVDSFRSEVLVFEESGANSWTAIGRLGTKGAGPKMLLLPMDVVVDEVTSLIYVTSTMTGRIETFTMGDLQP